MAWNKVFIAIPPILFWDKKMASNEVAQDHWKSASCRPYLFFYSDNLGLHSSCKTKFFDAASQSRRRYYSRCCNLSRRKTNLSRVGDALSMDSSQPVPKQYVEVAFQLADVAGSILRRHFRKTNRFLVKADQSPVTIADKEVERSLRTILKQKYPQHNILGEEEGQDVSDPLSTVSSSTFTWVIDPVDGTKAFMTGKPTFGTLIALLQGGIPVLGVVDQPILRERWFGARGHGAFYNGTPISSTLQNESSQQMKLENCVLYATSPDMFHNEVLDAFRRLSKRVQYTLYGCDCYAYALLANGFVDLVAEAEMKPWDYLALVPLIENAGGCITDWNGNPLTLSSSSGCVLAARTKSLHQQALEVLEFVSYPVDQETTHIQSMTGFSRAQAFGKYSLITVDLRSQNGRYLDICGTLPPMLESLESRIHDLLKQFLCRGRIHYSVSISVSEDSIPVSLMESSVKDIKQVLERIAEIANVQTAIDMNHILQFRDFLIRSNESLAQK